MPCFWIRTTRKFTYKRKRISFILHNKDILTTLSSKFKGTWYEIVPSKKNLENIRHRSGAYIISIKDSKNNIHDVCYVGCSRNLNRRLQSHKVIMFLNHALEKEMDIVIYYTYKKKRRILEDKLIIELEPFLNNRIPARKIINYKKTYGQYRYSN